MVVYAICGLVQQRWPCEGRTGGGEPEGIAPLSVVCSSGYGLAGLEQGSTLGEAFAQVVTCGQSEGEERGLGTRMTWTWLAGKQ